MSRRARPYAASCGNFFNLIRDFQQFKAMTPCVAINYRGIFIMTSILLLVAKCEDQLCSNCTEEHITRKVPGKCDVCWPCSECYVGYGLSVACGTTVSRDADIVCVPCTRGVNFSDTSGSEQCQPCATCAGKHEHVLENCNPEHNVKCECEDGYYRNMTTEECLPCVLCCTDDWKIAKRCRGDEGEIAKKCKFQIPWTKACFSSVSSTIGDVSKPIEHHSSVVVVTSSPLMKQSSLHPTATPLLERMTVSKTVKIKATSLSTPGHSRHISHHSVIVTILVSLFIFIVLGMVVLIVGCVVKCFLKKYKSKKSVGASQNDMEEGTENDDRESSLTGSVIIPLLQDTEDPYEITSVPLENDKTGETTDFSKNLPSSADQEGQGVNVQIEKGIPTSLDNEPRSKGQRPRKQIPSEEEDKKEPCLDGQQHHSYTDHYDEEPHTTVTVDKMLVSFHRDSPQATGLPAIRSQGSSSGNDAVPNSVVAFSPSDAEQMSGSHLSAQLDLELSVSISSVRAYATDVFLPPLASPSLISLKSSPTRTRLIIETDISHIHNQPSISATSSAGSHSSITVAVVETKEGDDSGTGQDSNVTVATLGLSGCGVALIVTIIVAIVYIFKKRGSNSICFLYDNNEDARPNLTSGSGDSESCSVLLSPEDDTALYVKLKDAQQDATCQENDSQPLQHIGQTLSDDGTVPPSLDDCSLGDDCQQNATSEGETGSDVAGSLQDPTLVASPETPSSLNIDLKPIAVPPYTCITSTPKWSVNILNFIQTTGASHDIFSAFDSRHVNANDVHKQRLDKKWATLSQAEKYSTKMQEVPFHLHHKVCLELDIPRFDGKDVREFASKLGITVPDCARLQQAAKIHNTTTTFIILQQTPGITVGDFVNIMKEMGRQDIADLIN